MIQDIPLLKTDVIQAILVHVPGDHLLASALIQVGRCRGLQVPSPSFPDDHPLTFNKLFVTYASESDKNYFLQVQNVPANYLISADVNAWTKDLDHSVRGQGIGAIIASTAANNHQDLWKYLKKNGKYLFLGGGSNIPNLSLFDKSIFAGGASFISFDVLDMLQNGEEDVKE